MEFQSAYIVRDLRTGDESVKNLHVPNFSCREGLIGSVHNPILHSCAERKQTAGSYAVTTTKVGELILDDPKVLGPGKTQFLVRATPTAQMPILGAEVAELVMKVADLVAGIPLLLLNPKRPAGDWWRTEKNFLPGGKDPATGLEKTANFCWWGSDNSVLFHPAYLSIAFGLYRQAYALVNAGMAEQVLASVPREEVEETLTAADWRRALGIIEAARPWIQVPIGKGGELGNYPFPWYQRATLKSTSYWQRLIRLHRAIRRHGYEAVFGNFFSGWNLDMSTPGICTGAFHFWGKDKELTEANKRLMELGKPLKRKASE